MTVERISPYKGLRPFEDTQEDVQFFFGRDRDREIIVANLIASRLTVLYGETGVGKSSVLRAGVAHQLRAEAERDLATQRASTHAVCLFDRWRDDPVEGVAAAAAATVRGALAAEVVQHEPTGSLADRLSAWTKLLGGDLYLVLDQTEEFFLYHEAGGARNPFVEELADVVRRPGLRVSVLISLREDAVAKLDRFKGPIPNVLGNYLRLDYLDRAAGRGAIVGPIEQYNALAGNGHVTIEEALIAAVLHEVATGRLELGMAGRGTVEGKGANGRIETPFLQLVMQRLWEEERRSGSNVLRLETLRRLGGAEQIVHDHLDQAMRALSSADKDVAASVFDHLVTPSGTKIAHGAADLARYAGVEEGRVQPVLTGLTGARILRPVAGDRGASRYEIYHDVLGAAILGWRTNHEAERDLVAERERARRRHRRLLGVIAVGSVLLALMAAMTAYALTQRNEAQEKTTLAVAAREDALEQAENARGARRVAESERAQADAARAAAVQSADEATAAREQAEQSEQEAEEQAQLAQSEAQRAEEEEARAEAEAANAMAAEQDAEREARNARRERAAALDARADADRSAASADARARAEEALTLLPSSPLQSLRLALGAAEDEPTELTERVLRTALVSSRVRHVLPGGGGPVTDASFSRDGRLVVTVADRARVFETRSGALLRALPDPARITSAELSPDGRSVVTSGLDGTARLWSVRTGPARVLRGHTRALQHATYSQDGRLVATAGTDRVAIVWSVARGERLATLEHEGPVFHVELSPDGGLAVTVSRVARTGRRVARLFDARSGAALRTYDQIGITTAIFSPDGGFVVTTSADDTARVWHHDQPQAAAVLRHLDGNVVSAAFSADGQRLVTATEGSSALVWHVGTWEKELGVVGALNPATGASFSPNRRHIVVSSRDRNAHIYHADNGLRVATLAGHGEAISVASFSPDGRALVTASDDGSARIWDPGTEDLLQTVGVTSQSPLRRVAASPDGRRAVSAGADGTARVVDVAQRRQLVVLRHDGPVNDASFSADGRLIVTASDDGSARLWRPAGELVRSLPHGGRVARAIFSQDGRLVATAGDDRTIRVWRARDGRLLRILRGHAGAVLDVAFSPDGSHLASAGDNADNTARVWSVDGRELHVLRHGGPVWRLAFSPDSRLLATASGDEKVRLFDVAGGRLRRVLRGHTAFVRDVAFRRDGKVLLTAADDGDARTWSVATGRPIRVLRGHFGAVSSAQFSPNGRWIVTAGPGTAGLWDARTGQFFTPTGLADPFLRGPVRGPLPSAVFMADGMRIVTASGDGTSRTYLCTPCGRLDALVRLARARLAALERGLDAAERRRYLRT